VKKGILSCQIILNYAKKTRKRRKKYCRVCVKKARGQAAGERGRVGKKVMPQKGGSSPIPAFPITGGVSGIRFLTRGATRGTKGRDNAAEKKV